MLRYVNGEGGGVPQTATDKTRLKVAMTVVKTLDPTLSREEILDKAIRNDYPTPDGGVVYAYVNHDRWVADCACKGAELVDPDEPVMLCGSCGASSTVVFPADADRMVEALNQRPVENRNFWAGQTLDDLVAENIDNGILPEVG